VKKFKFSMQSILNVNNTKKEVCEAELAEAQFALRKEEEKLSGIETQIKGAMDPAKAKDKCTSGFFLQREKYLRILKGQRRNQILRIQQAQTKTDSCMTRLKDATIEVKRMEKALEREFSAWELEFRRDEQKINDEIGNVRAFFNSREAV